MSRKITVLQLDDIVEDFMISETISTFFCSSMSQANKNLALQFLFHS